MQNNRIMSHLLTQIDSNATGIHKEAYVKFRRHRGLNIPTVQLCESSGTNVKGAMRIRRWFFVKVLPNVWVSTYILGVLTYTTA